MRKVHITLIGGQPAPVYNTIAALSPDYIVYIYSDSTRQQLNNIKSIITTGNEELKFDPTDVHRIKAETEQLAQRFSGDEVTVNISGGLKSWAYWFGIIFTGCPNASIVYIDQNNILWNYRTMEGIHIADLDILTLFRLHSNPIENNYTDYKDYTTADNCVLPNIEEIRCFDFQQFNTLTTVLTKENALKVRNDREGYFENPAQPETFIEWKKGNDEDINGEVTISIKKKNGKAKRWTLSSPHIIDLIFNAGWFEYKVATMISQWSKAKEIFLNCRFPLRKGVDKNEVDILVNTGTKVLFVECKTQIANTVDVDKFANVIKKYGGSGSKGLFVTDAPMNEVAIKKCEESGILGFSLQGVKLFSPEKALMMLLDSEIGRINAK